jgi:hypothetical protein
LAWYRFMSKRSVLTVVKWGVWKLLIREMYTGRPVHSTARSWHALGIG